MFFSKPTIIVTHSGSFHADDVFACAVVTLYLDQYKKKYKIIRSRDAFDIKRGDIVIDVGGIDDPSTQRFDHHQPGGAGERSNGIPYASFGLIWKTYGPQLCPHLDIVEEIDRRLVQPIDAIDNGISISESIECGLYDYGIHGIVSAFQSTWKDTSANEKQYNNFIELVHFFKDVVRREIEHAQHRLEMVEIITNAYEEAPRKDIIEIPYHVGIGPLMQVLDEHKEVKYIIAKSNSHWKALALRKESCSFENRKPFPQSWAGKRDGELQSVSGIPDALFCHNALFLAVAESREGAWALAEASLQEEH